MKVKLLEDCDHGKKGDEREIDATLGHRIAGWGLARIVQHDPPPKKATNMMVDKPPMRTPKPQENDDADDS